MATVLKIPAKFHPITHLPETKVQKRRVAAYARVSTDSEEQQTSYAAQVDRYTKYIQERADWEFVAVYTDEGISARIPNIGTVSIAWWQMLWTARSI